MDAEQLILTFVGVNMVSKITSDIGRDIANLTKTIESHADRWGRALMNVGKGSMIGGGLLLGGAALITKEVMDTTKVLEGQAHQAIVNAKAFGGTTDAAQELAYSAKMSGASMEDLTTAMKRSAMQHEQVILQQQIADKHIKTSTGTTTNLTDAIHRQEDAIAITEQKLATMGNTHTLVGKAAQQHMIHGESLTLTLERQRAELAKLEGGHGRSAAAAKLNKDETSLYIQGLKDLGITANASNGMLGDQVALMLQVADAMKTSTIPETNKLGILTKIYGRGAGPELMNYLSQGSAAIREQMKAAGESGAVIKGPAVQSLEELRKKNEELDEKMMGIKVTLITALLPAITALTNKVMEIVTAVNLWVQAHPTLARNLIIIAVVGMALVGVILVIAGVVLIVAGALSALAGIGIVLLIGAIVALLAILFVFRDKIAEFGRNVINTLVGVFNWIMNLEKSFGTMLIQSGKDMIMGLITGITSALPALKNVVTSIPGNVVNWMKQKAGIHSPSLMFAQEVGIPIMQGIHMGMGAGTPMLRDAAGLIGPSNVLGGGGGSTTNNNRSVGPITVNLYGVAGSPGDIGAAVRKELAAHFG